MQLRELAVRNSVNVVVVDEYNTSKLCSACLTESEGFPAKNKSKEGDEQVAKSNKGKGKESPMQGSLVIFSGVRKRPGYLFISLVDRRWCRNKDCLRVAWDRDMNASINTYGFSWTRPRGSHAIRHSVGQQKVGFVLALALASVLDPHIAFRLQKTQRRPRGAQIGSRSEPCWRRARFAEYMSSPDFVAFKPQLRAVRTRIHSYDSFQRQFSGEQVSSNQ